MSLSIFLGLFLIAWAISNVADSLKEIARAIEKEKK